MTMRSEKEIRERIEELDKIIEDSNEEDFRIEREALKWVLNEGD